MTIAITTNGRTRLDKLATEIRAAHKRASADMLIIGIKLMEARDILIGGFQNWVEDELSFSVRSAYNFINLARRFQDQPEIVAHLPPTILYNLASEQVSEKVIDTVAQRVESGEVLRVQDVKDIIKAARPAKSTVEDHIAEAAHEAAQEAAATGCVSVNGESVPASVTAFAAAITEATAEAIRADTEVIVRAAEKEDGVEGDPRYTGSATVDYISHDGRITLVAPKLAAVLKPRQHLHVIVYVKD